MSIEDFYESRYVKIAQTMRDIDRIVDALKSVFRGHPRFEGLDRLLREYGSAAKAESETIRSDPAIFEVWPRFVAAGEALLAFGPELPEGTSPQTERWHEGAAALIREGRELIGFLAGARVPMPKSTREYLEKCAAFPRTAESNAAMPAFPAPVSRVRGTA